MNWDEKAADCAVAHHTYEHLSFEENTRHATGFVRGAEWQREQMRTDEAVERVAAGMHEAADHFGHYTPWTDLPEHVREDWRKPARAAITALIGEEQ